MSRALAGWAGMVAAVGCYGGPGGSPPVAAGGGAEARAHVALTVGASSVGPISGQTTASLAALRALLVGFDVMPVNLRIGDVQRLGYNVYHHGERLICVLPDDSGAI